MQGFFDQVQVAHPYAGRVAGIAFERLPGSVEERQGRAYAKSFADVARHGLLGRAIPLHPVEGPDIPQLRVVHRRIGDAIIVWGNSVAKTGVGDAPKGVSAARAFFGGVKAAVGVIPGNLEELVQRLLEVLAQLIALGVVLIPQDLVGKALELPWVVIGSGQAGDQGLAETAATQRGNAGGQYVLRRAAVDTQGLTLEVQFAGVAGRTGDIQVLSLAVGVLVPGEPYRQVARVLRGGHLFGIDQEAKARQVLRRGKALLGERQLQGGEPVVVQAFYLSALGREVVGLAVGGTPLLLVVHLLYGHIIRQFGVEGVVEHHGQNQAQCDQYQE